MPPELRGGQKNLELEDFCRSGGRARSRTLRAARQACRNGQGRCRGGGDLPGGQGSSALHPGLTGQRLEGGALRLHPRRDGGLRFARSEAAADRLPDPALRRGLRGRGSRTGFAKRGARCVQITPFPSEFGLPDVHWRALRPAVGTLGDLGITVLNHLDLRASLWDAVPPRPDAAEGHLHRDAGGRARRADPVLDSPPARGSSAFPSCA